ncbi:DUF4118 domain-containing protein [Paenibacillus gansuensis]|uniref:histidine kinase n=1 Tax=Paenibacillus gansuensis TaxID=306542 RepID=A0ABW5PKY4_9BACL
MELQFGRRGTLTVFLGAAPAVGKTYAMLEAGVRQRQLGVDVRIGWLESAYPETLQLAEQSGLPLINCKAGAIDIERVSKSGAQLVLIDKLEGMNTAGAVRPKRYINVENLLSNGIDVYTTLNVGHVESLLDIAEQVMGSKVSDTVPDTFLEGADRIQLVDAATDEIIARISRAYEMDEDKETMRKRYRAGTVSALREMAFRYAAQRVDSQLQQYMKARDIIVPWPVSEKVMVCISPSPFSKQLIRMGRQMAAGLKAEWLAVNVQASRNGSQEERSQLEQNLQLAKELGAEVLSVTGERVAEELLAIARSHNVKQIIIGKHPRKSIRDWFRSSIVEQVLRRSHGMSVHVIAGSMESDAGGSASAPLRNLVHVPRQPYLKVTLFIACLTALLKPFGLAFDLVNIALLYLLPVLLSAVYGGRGPSIYAACLGVLAFDFFFVPPYISFTVSDLRYLISFAVYLAVAALTGSLAARLNQQLQVAKQREAHTSSLFALSRQMNTITDFHSLLTNVSRQISETMDTEAVIYLPDERGDLSSKNYSFMSSGWGQGEPERVIARWVFQHGEKAGRGAATLRESSGLYIPLRTEDRIYGVLAVNLEHTPVTQEQLRLLDAFGGLAASAIARVKLSEEARVAHLTVESERLRTAILDSVSHELKTPLATIIGSSTALMEGENLYSPDDRAELLSTIRYGALRMNRLVTNLLGMVQLESGMLRLRRNWCDVEDMIGVTLTQIKDYQQHRSIRVELQDQLPPLFGDEVLLEQVLVNIVSNAIKYSPDYSEIIIHAYEQGSWITISVMDNGMGISEDDLERIFNKFYRAPSTKHVPGTGLGLAICKGIVELHGGTISAQPNVGQGLVITVSLPKESQYAV